MDRMDKALISIVAAGMLLMASLAYTTGFVAPGGVQAVGKSNYGSPVAVTPVPDDVPIYVSELPNTGTGR
jgi:hypothetical protein